LLSLIQEIPEIKRNGEIDIQVTVNKTEATNGSSTDKLSGNRTSYSAVLIGSSSYVLQLESVSTNESIGRNASLKPVYIEIQKNSEGTEGSTSNNPCCAAGAGNICMMYAGYMTHLIRKFSG
jgi:hypothetical protein